ncbi:uncharacterized protein [Venturia canescens]|uniref:uncharacterized protein isoform X3 n=1 Tax=Venturia canescens TaxID=32260 RepID=UPI001C9D1844|nr:uncharacterized protein LOC122414095 isoform X3 [Venturia canescens]
MSGGTNGRTSIYAGSVQQHATVHQETKRRQKRVSDQRVAELETLLALARMRGKLVTVPVGFGRVDPARIGRKRRSSEDSGLEKLQRLLEAVERQSESISSEESAEKLAYFWNDAEDEGSLELTDQLI